MPVNAENAAIAGSECVANIFFVWKKFMKWYIHVSK